jgi:hypothetical protein
VGNETTYSILSVLSVTVVPLSQHDSLGNLVSILLLDETKDIGQSGVCLFVRMSDTHTTTGGNVVSLDSAISIDDSDEPDVIGQDIDRVVGWDSDGNLELSGKVGGTVEWLEVLNGITSNLLFVEPDLVVGGRTGKEVLRETLGELVDLLVEGRNGRVDGTLDVSVLTVSRNSFSSIRTNLLTSPHAAMESRQLLLIACIAGLRCFLMIPWNWKV